MVYNIMAELIRALGSVLISLTMKAEIAEIHTFQPVAI